MSQSPIQETLRKPRVLFVYFTYTQQTKLVAKAMADVLRERGCEVSQAGIEFDLSLAGYPEVFPVGDIAWITDAKSKNVLPQLGSVALQAGKQAGENIALRVAGKETKPFDYFDKGAMATIGHGSAVIQVPCGRTLKGRAAWLACGSVHLALLSTSEDRARAIVDWTWEEFTRERPGRITIDTEEDE